MLRLYTDNRIGNWPRRCLGNEKDAVLVPPEIRKCVAYIGYRDADGIHWKGTAFFTTVDLPEMPGGVTTYLVTAKHVINRVREKSIDKKVLVRLNTKGSGTEITETNLDMWWFHQEDDSLDVAYVNASQVVPQYECIPFPMRGMVTEKVIAEEKIDVGYDVFIVGLFRNHYGRKRNIPIIRVGNIAAIPEERISTSELGDIEAYLIEARSIGGLSGSPVFVCPGPFRLTGDGQAEVKNGPMYWLLGLMHGHFDLKDSEIDSATDDASVGGKVNVGIGIVVPAINIMKALNDPTTVKGRQNAIDEWRRSQESSPD
jgi:hypothetical protein